MTDLTASQKAEYVAHYGCRCPFCKSDDTPTIGPLEAEGGTAWQDVRCAKCEKTWQDIYKLVDVEEGT